MYTQSAIDNLLFSDSIALKLEDYVSISDLLDEISKTSPITIYIYLVESNLKILLDNLDDDYSNDNIYYYYGNELTDPLIYVKLKDLDINFYPIRTYFRDCINDLPDSKFVYYKDEYIFLYNYSFI